MAPSGRNKARTRSRSAEYKERTKTATADAAEVATGVALLFVPGMGLFRLASAAGKLTPRALDFVRKMKRLNPKAKVNKNPTPKQVADAKAPSEAAVKQAAKPKAQPKQAAAKKQAPKTQAEPKPKAQPKQAAKKAAPKTQAKPKTKTQQKQAAKKAAPKTATQPKTKAKQKQAAKKQAPKQTSKKTIAQKIKDNKVPIGLGAAVLGSAALIGSKSGTGPAKAEDRKRPQRPKPDQSIRRQRPQRPTPDQSIREKKRDESKRPKRPTPDQSLRKPVAKPDTNISAGKNTGFGPKGNIFPSSDAERKRLMDMYGGTGSAAAKAAMKGTQGNLRKRKGK